MNIRDLHPKLKIKFQFEPNGYQKAQNSMYILHKLLPFLKRVNEEQTWEMEIEARINGQVHLASVILSVGLGILVAHDGPGQEPVGSAQPALIDLDDFDDTTIVPNRRGMGMISRMMSFLPHTKHLKKLKTNHEDFGGRKIANWIKHKEPREVHMFVGLFLQELTAVGSEVKHILTPGLTRKHSRTESNGSTNSSRSNTLRDNHSNTIRARSQLMETHLANLFKQKMEIFTKEPDSPEAASASLDYVLGSEEPEQAPLSPEFNPGPELPDDKEIDLEEDSKDGPVDYLADGGDDDDDDDSFDDDEEDEEEHLAPADSVVAPAVDLVPSFEETELFETDKSAATPPPPPADHTTHLGARIYVQPQAPMPFPLEAEVDRSLTISTPPLSPLISLSPPSVEERLARCLAAPSLPSSPLPIPHHHPLHPSPPLPPLPSPPLLPLPSLPLPPLPTSLFIPLLVDRREDIPKAKLPPYKRLGLTALTSRFEVGESSTGAARPTGGHRADYGFIGTLDAEIRRSLCPSRGCSRQTDSLITKTRRIDRGQLVSPGDYDVDGAGGFSFLRGLGTGQLLAVLGQIQALQARDPTHADDLEGADSCAYKNMPPKRTSTAVRVADVAAARAAAAAPMTTVAVDKLIEARVSVALANHETL
ncbi:reverse transcriptase domain-containing protein [Tanacetum coccineum]|uniref:Vacuolar protein sorting-associated protein 51 homolog n=1 Tax=Tanacetum coccineum TaxID=301880 RepID=A0ABQ5G4C7_9ASTR